MGAALLAFTLWGTLRTVTFWFIAETRAPLDSLILYVALPKDDPHQHILDLTFPHPPDTILEEEGEPVARWAFYALRPGVYTLTYAVKVDLKALQTKGFLDPQAADLSPYLADGEAYRLQNPLIQQLGRQFTRLFQDPTRRMHALLRFVGEHVTYHLDGRWMPAPVVLETGQGSCSEYAFLYSALARASGLPTRLVGATLDRPHNGGIDEVFHRWVEVFIPEKGWVPVDPSAYPGADPLYGAPVGQFSPHALILSRRAGKSRYLGWGYIFGLDLSDPQAVENLRVFYYWAP